jgi:signal transduction histidine kinase
VPGKDQSGSDNKAIRLLVVDDEVISNLVSDAIKFTEQGRITVGTGIRDGAASVTVEDTG